MKIPKEDPILKAEMDKKRAAKDAYHWRGRYKNQNMQQLGEVGLRFQSLVFVSFDVWRQSPLCVVCSFSRLQSLQYVVDPFLAHGP